MYFSFLNDEYTDVIIKIIPCNISSIKERNNYQPIVVSGKEKDNYLKTINKYSKNYQYIETEDL